MRSSTTSNIPEDVPSLDLCLVLGGTPELLYHGSFQKEDEEKSGMK